MLSPESAAVLPPPVILRTCTMCNTTKPKNAFYRDGCKQCISTREKKRRQALRERTDEEIVAQQKLLFPDGLKFCTKCKVEHKLNLFPQDLRCISGLGACCHTKRKSCNRRTYTNRASKRKKLNRDAINRLRFLKHPDGKKKCADCKSKKSFVAFSKMTASPDILHNRCKSCESRRNEILRKRNEARNKSGQQLDESSVCVVCNQTKSTKEFFRQHGSLTGIARMCKICKFYYQAINKFLRKKFIRENLSTQCEVCGMDNPLVLQAAHKAGSEKARGRKGKMCTIDPCKLSLKRLKDEVLKLRSLCSNCHRLETKNELWMDPKKRSPRVEAAKSHVKQNKIRIGACALCNCKVSAENCCVFDFDHLNPLQKCMTIADMATEGKEPAEIDLEMSKCRLLCSSCHMIHTHQQRINEKQEIRLILRTTAAEAIREFVNRPDFVHDRTKYYVTVKDERATINTGDKSKVVKEATNELCPF